MPGTAAPNGQAIERRVGRVATTNEQPTSPSQGGHGSAGGDVLHAGGALAALRALPYGGIDDATRQFELPLQVRAAVTPAISALRWSSVAYGLVFAAPAAFRGQWAPVVALAVCLFLTTWRTVLPLRLASTSWTDSLPIWRCCADAIRMRRYRRTCGR